MSITNTPKFGITKWSNSATDGPTMAQFNALADAVENAAYDFQGSGLGARGAAGKIGRYYTDTSTGVKYRDNGTIWEVIGSNTLDSIFKNSVVNNSPLSIQAIASTTADLQNWSMASRANGTAKIDSNARLTLFDVSGQSTTVLGDSAAPIKTTLSSTTSTAKGIIVNALSVFAGTILQDWQANGTSVASVDKTGLLAATKLEAKTSFKSDVLAQFYTGAVAGSGVIAELFGGTTSTDTTQASRFKFDDFGKLTMNPLQDGSGRGAIDINSNEPAAQVIRVLLAGVVKASLTASGVFTAAQINSNGDSNTAGNAGVTGNLAVGGTVNVGGDTSISGNVYVAPTKQIIGTTRPSTFTTDADRDAFFSANGGAIAGQSCFMNYGGASDDRTPSLYIYSPVAGWINVEKHMITAAFGIASINRRPSPQPPLYTASDQGSLGANTQLNPLRFFLDIEYRAPGNYRPIVQATINGGAGSAYQVLAQGRYRVDATLFMRLNSGTTYSQIQILPCVWRGGNTLLGTSGPAGNYTVKQATTPEIFTFHGYIDCLAGDLLCLMMSVGASAVYLDSGGNTPVVPSSQESSALQSRVGQVSFQQVS